MSPSATFAYVDPPTIPEGQTMIEYRRANCWRPRSRLSRLALICLYPLRILDFMETKNGS